MQLKVSSNLCQKAKSEAYVASILCQTDSLSPKFLLNCAKKVELCNYKFLLICAKKVELCNHKFLQICAEKAELCNFKFLLICGEKAEYSHSVILPLISLAFYHLLFPPFYAKIIFPARSFKCT